MNPYEESRGGAAERKENCFLFERFQVFPGAELRNYTTLRLCGPADWLVMPRNAGEIPEILREAKEGGVKVSLRSKQLVDVAVIAHENGGGGHLRAAGFTAKTTLAEETAHMKRVLTDALRNA